MIGGETKVPEPWQREGDRLRRRGKKIDMPEFIKTGDREKSSSLRLQMGRVLAGYTSDPNPDPDRIIWLQSSSGPGSNYMDPTEP